MVSLFPVTLQLYPDEYAALGVVCEVFANQVLNQQHQPKRIAITNMVLADLYARLFSYARQQIWERRRANKRYTLRLSILYVRLLHGVMQDMPITPPQQRVLTQLDQLLQ